MKRACCGAAMMMAGMALSACTPEEPAPRDTCGASALSGFIGQPAEVLTAHLADRPMRVIGPDTMVTMDFVEGRVNVHTDAAGIVLRIDCG